jgi:hypothetical protein
LPDRWTAFTGSKPGNSPENLLRLRSRSRFFEVSNLFVDQGVPAKHPEIDRQIIASVDRQLQSRGLRRVEDAGQIIVSYHAAVINSFDGATVATPGTWGPGAGSMDQVWQVVRGSLIIEIVDGTTKIELWRVNALDTLSNEATFDVSKNLDKGIRKVNKVVEKMFKYYPSTKPKS